MPHLLPNQECRTFLFVLLRIILESCISVLRTLLAEGDPPKVCENGVSDASLVGDPFHPDSEVGSSRIFFPKVPSSSFYECREIPPPASPFPFSPHGIAPPATFVLFLPPSLPTPLLECQKQQPAIGRQHMFDAFKKCFAHIHICSYRSNLALLIASPDRRVWIVPSCLPMANMDS